jgi:hypothetical protein
MGSVCGEGFARIIGRFHFFETNSGARILDRKWRCDLQRRDKTEVATIKDGALYSLEGAPLGVTLADLNSQMSSDPDALAKFKTPP